MCTASHLNSDETSRLGGTKTGTMSTMDQVGDDATSLTPPVEGDRREVSDVEESTIPPGPP